MESTTAEKQSQETPQIPFPPKFSIGLGDKIEKDLSVGRKNGYSPMSHRTCTCSNRPGSARCARHGYLVPPGDRFKKRPASKEILRRALTPPPRRLGLRWLNFRPTPSRLSQMSLA